MQIAILLYDGVVALDAIGPYDVLKLVPRTDVRLVAVAPGEVETDGPLRLVAPEALEAVPRPDVVVVPGGPGAPAASRDERTLEWLRRAHEHTRFTASVCWGSELLGAAGLLREVGATSHWLVRDELARHGAIPVDERVVVSGRIITSAGVSAGIDMALRLAALIAGDEVAERIQLTLEYAPEPPSSAAGSPDTASPRLVAQLREGYARSRRRARPRRR
ncbi:MAG TPA: DJ-1/PfpI family protein [Solirubrobacteraceae bacterium]|nr:DJ-1/PfpI family protein [Solirubrobacteraceae bacterium]